MAFLITTFLTTMDDDVPHTSPPGGVPHHPEEEEPRRKNLSPRNRNLGGQSVFLCEKYKRHKRQIYPLYPSFIHSFFLSRSKSQPCRLSFL